MNADNSRFIHYPRSTPKPDSYFSLASLQAKQIRAIREDPRFDLRFFALWPMDLAAVSRRIGHRWPVTEIALGAHRKYRRCVAFHVLCADIVCRE
jgi:hypothetical protein